MRRFHNTAIRTLLGVGVLVAVFSIGYLARAQSLDLPSEFAGLSSQDIKVTAENIVRIVFGFLGVLAVLLILYGGFIWMTSGGNADKIDQAKRILTSAVIGLLLILMSYAIASFIVGRLGDSTGSGGPGGPGGPPGPGPLPIGAGVIESHYPGVNAVNIPRNTNIVITFKEAIDVDTIVSGGVVNSANVKIENLVTGATYSATGQSPDGLTFIIDPDSPLGSVSGDERHRVTLGTGIKKESGATALPVGYSWNFTVSSTSDTTSPEVVSVIPVPGSTVDRNTMVQINFSEPISPVTATGNAPAFSNITLTSPAGIASGVYSIGNQYFTVEFRTDQMCGTNSCGGDVFCLEGGVQFTGDATAAVTDMAGNPLVAYTWTFDTNNNIDLIPPVISSQTPRHGTPAVDVNAPVSVTFSKLMSVASINSSNINLSNSGYWLQAVNVGSQTTVNIYHQQFAARTAYDVAVTSRVKDINQNCYSPCQCISSDGSCGCVDPKPGCTGLNCTSDDES